ncbi:DUF7619 domain-containing protein [Pontibacter qinzhouensis]|nr:IPT/TIG domain-containing protein [Pontibacter qinzhouensis]
MFDKDQNLFTLNLENSKVVKYNPAKQEVLAMGGSGAGIVNPQTMTVDDAGNVYILDVENRKFNIKKFDKFGNKLGTLSGIEGSYDANANGHISAGLAVDTDGNMYVTNYNSNTLIKYSAQGKILFKIASVGKEQGQLWKPLDVCLDPVGNVFIADINGNRIQKFSSSGVFLQQFGTFRTNEFDQVRYASISSDAYGHILVAAHNGSINVYDGRGKVVASLPHKASNIALSHDGKTIASSINLMDMISIYETDYSFQYNIITGKLYYDKNNDCVLDPSEDGLANIILKAEPGPYFTITDELGNYSFQVDKGHYTIIPSVENKGENQTKFFCKPEAKEIQFSSYGNTYSGNNIGTELKASPYLSVSVSSDRRRRCFPGTTTVTYSNTGFAPAKDAKVYLQLPEYVVLKSANKPYTRLGDGTYAFEAGTIAAGKNGSITIQDSVICGDESIRGLTVCTRAWITPVNQPTGGKATTSVTGVCNYATGHIRFVIRNIGQKAMPAKNSYRIYQDGQLATVEDYQLAAGDSMVLQIPANGKTIRLEADQPDGNGDNTLASATVEACREVAARMAVSKNFVNTFPTDDEEAEVAEECLPIIDSYDPNDKLVTPVGLTEQNYTATGANLKYKIRFQNTGTDVAYRVVVVDTLSQHLDLATLQMGTISHNYTFSVSGKGQPVLTWTFHNIMLPDSTSNEPGSHGYIQFSIQPKVDLPEKTAIENFADIFFDYNSPIRTNLTINRIYDLPQEIKEQNRIVADDVIMTPTIANFSPATGKFGTEVTVTGTKFSEDLRHNKVYFNGVLAEVVAGDAQNLKVRVPAGASTGTLKILTENGGTSSTLLFMVYQPPVISSVLPAQGTVGAEVTLTGNYLTEDLLEQVMLGAILCDVKRQTQNQLVVTIPAGAVTGNFKVLTKGGEHVSMQPFRVWHTPGITATDTAMQRVGGKVRIKGLNFAPEVIYNTVQFGNIQAEVLQASEQVLQVRVPQGAQSGQLSVTTPGGTAVRPFAIIPAPQLTEVLPASASVGTEVELKGIHFAAIGKADTILFNNLKAAVITSSATSYTVRVPRGAETGKVIVAGSGGRAEASFVVEPLTPQEAITLYPNPGSGRFTLDFLKADFDIFSLQVFDARGKLVQAEQLSSGQADKLEVDLTSHAGGIYLMRIYTARGIIVKQVVLL